MLVNMRGDNTTKLLNSGDNPRVELLEGKDDGKAIALMEGGLLSWW